MKISMWMIAEKMEKYHPESNILDGTAQITGVRFLSGPKDVPPEPRFVYLHLNYPTAILINGRDSITVHTQNISELLNELLAVFDYYNNWEKALWDAAAQKSFQQIIDLGHETLGNPMVVTDMHGNILAMSSAFAGDDINDYWVDIRNSHRIPPAILSMPLYSPTGKPASWTDTPSIYIQGNGTKIIGTYIKSDGNLIAGLALWQYKRPILPSDLYLVQILYEVMISTLDAQYRSVPARFYASILKDLLAGNPVGDKQLQHLQRQTQGPCRLLVIRNPLRSDMIYQHVIEQRLLTQEPNCVPLIYEDNVVVLTSDIHADALAQSVLGSQDQQHYLTGVSLPFEDFHNLPVHYAQTQFALKQGGDKPGIYRLEDFALQYLLSLITQQTPKQCLTHPALLRLKQYDSEKENGLYKTLYQYLLNERSVTQCARAMHMHKNSLIYRLQRIQEMIDVDLDDPMARNYLLLCYLMNNSDES